MVLKILKCEVVNAAENLNYSLSRVQQTQNIYVFDSGTEKALFLHFQNNRYHIDNI